MKRRTLTKADQRARIIERLMKLTWSSLDSHLGATYASKRELGKLDGKKPWQKTCVKDYALTIFLISQLY